MSELKVNLEKLRGTIHENDFISELTYLSSNLNLLTRMKEDFFQIILNFLKKEDISKECGDSILLQLCKIFCTKSYVSNFVKNKFVEKLPFDKEDFHLMILDVLYFITVYNPNGLPNEILEHFKCLMKSYPDKCLILLSNIAEDFGNITNPWNYFTYLISEYSLFDTEELTEMYVKFLVYLCTKYTTFRDTYINKIWKSFARLLIKNLSSGGPSKSSSYVLTGLCALYDLKHDINFGKYPDVCSLIKLLSNEETTSLTLNLLLRTVPRVVIDGMEGLVKILTEVAIKNKKASLILMEMGLENESLAELIIKYPEWIRHEIPSVKETIRLFAIILRYKNLRVKLFENPDIIADLFINTLKYDNEICVYIIYTYGKRLPIDKPFVDYIGQKGFIQKYIERFINSEEEKILVSGFLLMKSFASISYHEDYKYLLRNLPQRLNDKKTAKVCAQLIAVLSSFPELKDDIKGCNIIELFKLSENTDVSGYYQKLCANLECV